jgi:hypothetical protein
MLVKLLAPYGDHKAGVEVELPAATGKNLVAAGFAVEKPTKAKKAD